jgi:antitoxin HicB
VDYPITLDRDDNGTWLVSFPDFPEAHTFGRDVPDALAHARDALATILDASIKDKRPIPPPSATRSRYSVRLPALMAAKIGLYEAMRTAGVGKAELARRLECHLPQIDRLLALTHGSQLAHLEAAVQVLGKRLDVAVQDVTAPARAAAPARSTLDEQVHRLSPARRRKIAALIALELTRQDHRGANGQSVRRSRAKGIVRRPRTAA